MPGRDITRLRNRNISTLLSPLFVTAAALCLFLPSWSQQSTNQSSSTAGAQKNSASQEQKQTQPDDQGTYVLRTDVDEVMLHA